MSEVTTPHTALSLPTTPLDDASLAAVMGARTLAFNGGEPHAASLLYLAERWSNLPPHIRDAVITLIDAANTPKTGHNVVGPEQ